MTKIKPALSVVVIGKNEGERLLKCLDSIREMRRPFGEIEIIYVDSDSTDRSRERAAVQSDRVIHLQDPNPCAAKARNAGWKVASAEIVLFLDGDTILHPDFVASSLADLDDPSVAVVWGHRRELRPDASIFNRVLDLDWIYPAGDSEFCGGDALVRRSVLRRIGGFDESLIAGEEPEMCARIRGLGLCIRHVDRLMSSHDLAIKTWSQYWKRAFRAGYAYAEVSRRFRDDAGALWQREVRRNFVHGSLVLALPLVSLALALELGAVWPLAAVVAGSLAVTARTAARAHWKSSDPATLLLYGLHAHLQQAPILIGQLAYHRDRRRNQARALIDYKQGPT